MSHKKLCCCPACLCAPPPELTVTIAGVINNPGGPPCEQCSVANGTRTIPIVVPSVLGSPDGSPGCYIVEGVHYAAWMDSFSGALCDLTTFIIRVEIGWNPTAGTRTINVEILGYMTVRGGGQVITEALGFLLTENNSVPFTCSQLASKNIPLDPANTCGNGGGATCHVSA